MFVLYILSVSLCLGMASNALLMSTVINNVLCAGLFALMPSKECWVRPVSRVVVECSALNPCWEGTVGMCCFIMFSIRRSVILDGVHSSVIGLYDDGSVASLFGFSSVIIAPCFQMLGIML